MPRLDDPEGSVKDAAFLQVQWENRIFGRTVRASRYPYIRWESNGGGEGLCDHTSDAREFTSLATDLAHSAAL